MATQAELEARIEQLQADLAGSEARITHEGKTVEFRTIADTKAALAATQAQLAALTGALRRRVKFTDCPNGKGWA